jgi:hypothetical protein
VSVSPAVLNMLRLARTGAEKSADGWAPVSKPVWPLIESIPTDLLERRDGREGGGGFCRLTPEGETVLKWA